MTLVAIAFLMDLILGTETSKSKKLPVAQCRNVGGCDCEKPGPAQTGPLLKNRRITK